jgi:hypothetical protein
MLMSDAEAATSQWITITAPVAWSVANATGEALPVAFVSLEIAAAVAVPLEATPNGVALNPSVATAVPGDATELGEILNTRLPDAPSSVVTASVAAFFAAVECVTAILNLL